MAWGFGVAMIIENTIIAMQSLRGVRSHMNIATVFDGAAFGVMGVFIAFNTVLVAVLLVLFLRTRTGLPMAVTCGIWLGLAVMLAGSFEGVFMIARYWGHTVGAKDGGAGAAVRELEHAAWRHAGGALLRAPCVAGVCAGGVGDVAGAGEGVDADGGDGGVRSGV